MTDPRAGADDLTAKARIRNAALDLYAERGEDRVSLRTVAAAADVTVGLVQHHYKTKNGLRSAVEQLVVDYYAQAISRASSDGGPAQVAAARDTSVQLMLRANPPVADYLRRVLLEPNRPQSQLLERLTELTRSEITKLREAGLASTSRPASTQIVAIMVRQLGQMFLQPMIDTMWEHLADPAAEQAMKPTLEVTVQTPPPEARHG
ncbi:TetR/AcrR family transcriptional regulator [Streptomyces albipurpureus]|uniref:TetR/AcrR family transcriptional regulator n=1 Tax=Streptomyces albipurpureus TaxID=2897419 RepID=A0ABT0UYB0_9ACTN|nr:TetR/AcrR family transcriptional regulator [Streptomyces sp. CWNU-1]MCM2393568.1 TetR/AcrR family transcriptional regulator [Streptomyces sp. CWNU-1]